MDNILCSCKRFSIKRNLKDFILKLLFADFKRNITSDSMVIKWTG